MTQHLSSIKAIIGLGNPGKKYEKTRHNIGFLVVDALADAYGASWNEKPLMHTAQITINTVPVLLIKPQTFMNNSGEVIPQLTKQGIKAENILVVHDELEIPFGQIKTRSAGSARGHNGLKSIIAACGDEFHRLRLGIGRPDDKNDVPEYVLAPFSEQSHELAAFIDQSVAAIVKLIG